jgi:hypothetical protein
MKTSLIIISIFMGSLITFAQNKVSFSENYEVKTPATFKAAVSDGYIIVNPSETNKIEIDFIVKKGISHVNISKEELSEFIDMEISTTSSHIEISIKDRNSNRMNSWKNTYSVSLDIKVPVETSCNLQTSDGDIKLSGLTGKQQCRTSDGDVEIFKTEGNIIARTSDGDIKAYDNTGSVDLTTSDGDIVIEDINGDATLVTSDGDINMYAVAGFSSARTSDGDITFRDLAGALHAQTSDGDIIGNFIKLSGNLKMATSDGDVKVTIPQGLGMDIYLKGEDLHTNLVDFSGEAKEHLIKGKIRGGGIPIELTTSDGVVQLAYE